MKNISFKYTVKSKSVVDHAQNSILRKKIKKKSWISTMKYTVLSCTIQNIHFTESGEQLVQNQKFLLTHIFFPYRSIRSHSRYLYNVYTYFANHNSSSVQVA